MRHGLSHRAATATDLLLHCLSIANTQQPTLPRINMRTASVQDDSRRCGSGAWLLPEEWRDNVVHMYHVPENNSQIPAEFADADCWSR